MPLIAGGPPLCDAVGFGQWNAARRLVERGAQLKLWHAAALGLMDRLNYDNYGTWNTQTNDDVYWAEQI